MISYSYGQEVNKTDIVTSQKTQDSISKKVEEIRGFRMYPNPVTSGVLRINTLENAEKSIQIFDVLGKKVLSKTTKSGLINVATLNSGIYILKVTELGKTSTRKLVIK